jgi:superfamily II DNA/RNA helicase
VPEYFNDLDNRLDPRLRPGYPLEIILKPEELTLEGILQYYWALQAESTAGAHGDRRESTYALKCNAIVSLNQEHTIPICMIYVNNNETAERLKQDLLDEGISCDCIYGAMTPARRNEACANFRRMETRVLISTDLLARGFDVQSISLVINFDLPLIYDRASERPDPDKLASYLHRIGRSGRYGRKGVAINLIASAEEEQRKAEIEKFYGVNMKPLPDQLNELW